jgi:hypothetical protein
MRQRPSIEEQFSRGNAPSHPDRRAIGHGPSLKSAPAASGAEIPSEGVILLAPITTCASVSEHKISDFQALVAQFCSEISASSAEPALSFCPVSQPHDHLLRADLATFRILGSSGSGCLSKSPRPKTDRSGYGYTAENVHL